MSKLKVIVRKVSSAYSEKSGWAAEFLDKSGKRFFIAEQFDKELTVAEEQLARPLDIVHLVGYAWKFAKDNKHALSRTLKAFGQACYDESCAIDRVKRELAKVRKVRNLLAQEVADIALPLSARKLLHDKTDEETKNAYAAAVVTYDNRVRRATPKFNAFNQAIKRLTAVLDMTEEERARFA